MEFNTNRQEKKNGVVFRIKRFLFGESSQSDEEFPQCETHWQGDEQCLNEELKSCRTVSGFDRVYDNYKFPKNVEKRFLHLIKATSRPVGSIMEKDRSRRYSNQEYLLSQQYEDYKFWVLWHGGKLLD